MREWPGALFIVRKEVEQYSSPMKIAINGQRVEVSGGIYL